MRYLAKLLIVFLVLGGCLLQGQEAERRGSRPPSGRAPGLQVPRGKPSPIPRSVAPRSVNPRVVPRVAPKVAPRARVPRSVAPRGTQREPGLRPIPRVGPRLRPMIPPQPRLPRVNPLPPMNPRVEPQSPRVHPKSGPGIYSPKGRVPSYGGGSHYGRRYPDRHYGRRMHGSVWPLLYSYRWFMGSMFGTYLPYADGFLFCGVPISYIVFDLEIIVQFEGGEQLVLVPLGLDPSWLILNSIQEAITSGRSICLEVSR